MKDEQSRLAQWLLVARRDAKRVTATAYHLLVSGRQELVTERADIETSDEALTSLAGDLVDTIANDASVLGGVQSYVIRMTEGGRDLGRHAVRMRADEALTSTEALSSEPASATGLLAQLMRHNEVTSRMLVLQATHSADTLRRENESLRERMSAYERNQLEAVRLQEELLSRKAEREIAALKAKTEAKQADVVTDTITLLVPTVVNRMAGAQILPEKSSPSWEMIKSFMRTITMEQIQAMRVFLEPPQFIALVELWKKVDEEERAAREAAAVSNKSN